jgi:hypothetical protein
VNILRLFHKPTDDQRLDISIRKRFKVWTGDINIEDENVKLIICQYNEDIDDSYLMNALNSKRI